LTRRFVSRQRGLELAPRLRDAEGREQRKLDRHVLDHVRGWWNRVVEEVARRAAILPDDEAWPDRASEEGRGGAEGVVVPRLDHHVETLASKSRQLGEKASRPPKEIALLEGLQAVDVGQALDQVALGGGVEENDPRPGQAAPQRAQQGDRQQDVAHALVGADDQHPLHPLYRPAPRLAEDEKSQADDHGPPQGAQRSHDDSVGRASSTSRTGMPSRTGKASRQPRQTISPSDSVSSPLHRGQARISAGSKVFTKTPSKRAQERCRGGLRQRPLVEREKRLPAPPRRI